MILQYGKVRNRVKDNLKETREKIISSAWEMIEEDGLEKFSMRKLAEKVNKTVSTLYHYYPSKEALLSELVEVALTEIVYPVDSVSWKHKLEDYGRNILRVLKKYPSLATLLFDIPPVQPNYVALNDNLLMIANDIPIDKKERLYFINMFLNFILTFKIDSDRLANNNLEKIQDFSNQTPYLKSYKNEGLFEKLGTNEMFVFGLKILINGIEKRTF